MYQSNLSIHFNKKTIYPFETIVDRGIKGEMKYYQFVIENIENILITLDIKSGEADLYLGKGIGKLPTKNNYYKKSVTYKGD